MSSKKIHLRLYADENYPVPSSTYLKSLGISVVHAFDLNMVNKSDKLHIKKAKKKLDRTIITIDRDFLYYSELTTPNSHGAIVIATGDPTPLHINEICKKALPKISSNSVKGAFITITTDKIVRKKGQALEEITI